MALLLSPHRRSAARSTAVPRRARPPLPRNVARARGLRSAAPAGAPAAAALRTSRAAVSAKARRVSEAHAQDGRLAPRRFDSARASRRSLAYLVDRGEPLPAEPLFAEALDRGRGAGLDELAAHAEVGLEGARERIVTALVRSASIAGAPMDALRRLLQARRTAERMRDRRALWAVLEVLRIHYGARGSPGLAVRFSREGFAVATAMADQMLVATSAAAIAIDLRVAGRVREALLWLAGTETELLSPDGCADARAYARRVRRRSTRHGGDVVGALRERALAFALLGLRLRANVMNGAIEPLIGVRR